MAMGFLWADEKVLELVVMVAQLSLSYKALNCILQKGKLDLLLFNRTYIISFFNAFF